MRGELRTAPVERLRRRRQIKRPASRRPFSRLDTEVRIRDTKSVSVFGSRRATPAKPVVHPDLDGVFVVPEALASDVGGASVEGGLAEIVILVFGLGRPVGREHVFE